MPLRLDYLRARGRAPTRGAHTVGLFARAGEGTHEGCPYGWIICAHGGGHPRGGHIRLDDVGARGEGTHEGGTYGWVTWARARGRAPTRGAHTVGWRGRAGEGTHEGCPVVGLFARAGRAPTRGGPVVGLLGRARTGEGTHEGCPYGWVTRRRR